MGVRLIAQENNTIYWCPSCGNKLTPNKVKYGSKVQARYGPANKSKPIIASQTQEQRRGKNKGKAENVPGNITEEDIDDLKDLGVEVTRAD